MRAITGKAISPPTFSLLSTMRLFLTQWLWMPQSRVWCCGFPQATLEVAEIDGAFILPPPSAASPAPHRCGLWGFTWRMSWLSPLQDCPEECHWDLIESLLPRDLFAGCALHSVCKHQDVLRAKAEGGRSGQLPCPQKNPRSPAQKQNADNCVHGASPLVGLVFSQASASVCGLLCLMVPWPVHSLGGEESL